MHDFENSSSPYEEKKQSIGAWKALANEYCPSSDDILKAGQEIQKLGIKPKDALHIACAVSLGCDYFITTDNGILNKTVENIKIVNPIDFVRETEDLL
jgi:predicted nucleic acid-binding protein